MDEDEFLLRGERVGPYLTCLRGLAFEERQAPAAPTEAEDREIHFGAPWKRALSTQESA